MRLWLTAIACATFLVFWLWRDYPWTLALLAAIAVGALVHAAWKSFGRLRDLYRSPDLPESKTDPL